MTLTLPPYRPTNSRLTRLIEAVKTAYVNWHLRRQEAEIDPIFVVDEIHARWLQ